ncbi:hypothetical protein [Nonomuraea sp. JJY05]
MPNSTTPTGLTRNAPAKVRNAARVCAAEVPAGKKAGPRTRAAAVP